MGVPVWGAVHVVQHMAQQVISHAEATLVCSWQTFFSCLNSVPAQVGILQLEQR